MKGFTWITYAILIAATCSGCATIVSSSTQPIQFTTLPSGASVIVDGMHLGTTPGTYALERGVDHIVELNLAGFEPASMQLRREINGWVWGNIVFGGVIGVVVDVATGAIYKLTPEAVEASLGESSAVSYTGEDGQLLVSVRLIPDNAGLEKIGQLVRK